METEDSTSSKPAVNDNDRPALILPPGIHAKIIVKIPIAHSPAMGVLNNNIPNFAIEIAFRQLRNINVDNDESVKSILQKLAEHSALLTSSNEFDVRSADAELNLDTVQSLAQFERLQSITMGDARSFCDERKKMPLEAVVEFLESFRSRTSLKELRLYDIDDCHAILPELIEIRQAIVARFVSAFDKGRECTLPLELKKFLFSSSDMKLFIRLDTLDTTRLIDVRVGKASVEPDQLTNFIGRASHLRRIELSFLSCGYRSCNGPHLQANKDLLKALGSHEKLTAMKFYSRGKNDCNCVNFVPEFIEMLEKIGNRGRLRKLGLENFFLPSPKVYQISDQKSCMDEICTTIRNYIPYLQSITLNVNYIFEENVCKIFSLLELEEIDLKNSAVALTGNAIPKIAQLSCLKRLALDAYDVEDRGVQVHLTKPYSLGCLADASMLTDLRIGHAHLISADVFVNWSNGFASNLQILMLSKISEKDEPKPKPEPEPGSRTKPIDNRTEEEKQQEREHRRRRMEMENGLVRLLKKAVRLRVLILEGCMTGLSLMAIAKSCPDLEILGFKSISNRIKIRHLREIVQRCPKLRRLGGIGSEIRNKLQIPKHRKIGDVDMEFSDVDFDGEEND